MPTPRLLKKAPIREAVVEVRIPKLQDGDALGSLEEMARNLPGYPSIQAGFEFQGQFRFDPAGDVEADHETRPTGFRAISADEKQIVQIRLNGVSISRLEPYVSWEQLQTEASAVWSAYKARFEPDHVDRFGLRYINNLRLPYPISDLNEFLVGLPDAPPEWPQAVSSFLYRQTLHDLETGCAATVMHALADDVDETRIGVIFDIDTYIEGAFGTEEDQVWGTFAELRTLKNNIFFSGITEHALTLFA